MCERSSNITGTSGRAHGKGEANLQYWIGQLGLGTSSERLLPYFLKTESREMTPSRLARVGAIDHGNERVIVDVAEGGIEWEIGVKAGQRLRRGERSRA